jgi:hypothetical protein
MLFISIIIKILVYYLLMVKSYSEQRAGRYLMTRLFANKTLKTEFIKVLVILNDISKHKVRLLGIIKIELPNLK